MNNRGFVKIPLLRPPSAFHLFLLLEQAVTERQVDLGRSDLKISVGIKIIAFRRPTGSAGY